MKNEVINSYKKSSIDYFGNSNSLHELGVKAKKLEDAASNQVLEVLNLKNKEVIYTSGTAENYTMILKTIKSDKNIVTNNKELYEIGKDMNINIKYGDVKELIDKNTQLVSVTDDIELPEYSGLLHINMTTSNNNLNKYNFITLEEIPAFGCLIKDKNIVLKPLVNGGKSTTPYRSGTSATNLIVSFSKLIKLKYKK